MFINFIVTILSNLIETIYRNMVEICRKANELNQYL